MNRLHIKDNLKSFLYDLDNFITIYDNNIHVFNYLKLNKLSSEEICLQMDNYEIKISGVDLTIKKMTKNELLIMGKFLKVLFNYE